MPKQTDPAETPETAPDEAPVPAQELPEQEQDPRVAAYDNPHDAPNFSLYRA